jgi:hypothetical protein
MTYQESQSLITRKKKKEAGLIRLLILAFLGMSAIIAYGYTA